MTQKPTFDKMLHLAFSAAKTRYGLLITLSLGVGMLMRLSFLPLQPLIADIMEIIPPNGKITDENLAAALVALGQGAWRFLVVQVLMITATAIALAPWARAQTGRVVTLFKPHDTKHTLMAFVFLLTVSGVSLVINSIILSILQLIGAAAPIMAPLLLVIFIIVSFYVFFYLTTAAHMIIACDAIGRRECMRHAMFRVGNYGKPAIALLAFLIITFFLVFATFGQFLIAALPEQVRLTSALILMGGLSFAAYAMHVAAVMKLPDPRFPPQTDDSFTPPRH